MDTWRIIVPRPNRSSGVVATARRHPLPSRTTAVGELPGLIEIADADQVFGMRRGRIRDVAPACGVGFNRQQVQQQLMVEAAQGRIADRSQPLSDPLRRIVADRFDLDSARVRALDNSRPYCSDTNSSDIVSIVSTRFQSASKPSPPAPDASTSSWASPSSCALALSGASAWNAWASRSVAPVP